MISERRMHAQLLRLFVIPERIEHSIQGPTTTLLHSFEADSHSSINTRIEHLRTQH